MERIGSYRLITKLGQGGMAEVWKGIRRAEVGDAEKLVAVKLIAGHATHDPKFRELFLREARVSMFLSHSTIAQVFDVGIENDRLYMVMEYVEGINAKELIGSRGSEQLDFPVIAYIIAEVLRALAYAHELERDGAPVSVVHRDISPHNIMISSSGEIKVTDFGVASFSIEETNSGSVKGKLQYMPPEQLTGESRKPTIDIYAVGAVLHELLELRPFRQAQDYRRVLGMIYLGETPALTREGIPEHLRVLHTRMLEANPDRRIQSAAEALEYLYTWPGFRNSSFELGAMVKQIRRTREQHPSTRRMSAHGPEPATTDTLRAPAIGGRESETPTEPGTVARVVQLAGTTRTLAASQSSMPTVAMTEQLAPLEPDEIAESLSERTEVESLASVPEQQAATTVLPAPPPVQAVRAARPGRLIAGLMSIGALAILASVAYAVIPGQNSRNDELHTEQAEDPPSTRPPPAELPATEPAPKDAPPPEPADQPTPPEQPQPTLTPDPIEPEPEPAPAKPVQKPAQTKPAQPKPAQPKPAQPKAEPSKRTSPDKPISEEPKAPTPVSLVVSRGDYFCTEVKLRDGKKFEVVVSLRTTGSKQISIPPGTYLVQIKVDCADQWTNAGQAIIKSGGKQKLVPRKPANIDLLDL